MTIRRFKFLIALFVSIAALLIGSYGGHGINNGSLQGDIEAPKEVKDILRRACYDCHSNETKLAWFDKFPIISIAVRKDVEEGRQHLNFSEWAQISPSERKAKLWEIYNMTRVNRMPPRSYLRFHSTAQLSIKDQHILKDYIDRLSLTHINNSTAIQSANTQYITWKQRSKTVPGPSLSPNGIRHMPDYRSWQVLSTTSRFDNGTLRVIYANQIATQALKKKKINPWPDGSVIVKAMWEKIEDGEGNVRPGKFMNLQYMIKDKVKYRRTEGWGFARFDGLALKPYGTALTLDMECINCHKVVEQNDFVFNLSMKQ